MEYLIEVLEKQGGKELLDFPSEFGSLPEVVRLSMSEIRKELSAAQEKLSFLQREVEFSSRDPSARGFVDQLSSFVLHAEVYLQSLEMEYARVVKSVEDLALHFGEERTVPHNLLFKYLLNFVSVFVKSRTAKEMKERRSSMGKLSKRGSVSSNLK